MYAENAILAKSRALFAKRLTKKHYSEMLQCNNVREVASYLKTKTPYAEYLSNLNVSSVHRGWLEANLKNILYIKYDSLSHYDYTLGDDFYKYFVISGECDQITRCVMLMNSGDKEKYLITLPSFFNSRTKIDLVALGKADSYSELLNVINGTPYHKILKKFMKNDSDSIDVMGFSSAMDEYVFSVFFDVIKNSSNGKAREALYEMARLKIDMYNVEKLYRLGRLQRHGIDALLASHMMSNGSLKDETLQNIINSKSAKEVVSVLKNTKYGKYLKDDYDYVELATAAVIRNMSIHQLRFSSNPLVVMFAYSNLLDTEIKDIIHIIEGIRYNVPSEEINKLLVDTD